jgi:hypothetical protein
LLVAILLHQERHVRTSVPAEVVTILLQVPRADRQPVLTVGLLPALPHRLPVQESRKAIHTPLSTRVPTATVSARQEDAVAPDSDPITPSDTLADVATPARALGTDISSSSTAVPSAEFNFSLALNQAGRIDRNLRNGKSGVALQTETPWSRFQRGIESAYIDRSMSGTLDSYTSPDGIVIYRERVGGRTTCRRTGGIHVGIPGVAGANDAGTVTCPAGVNWKRGD